MTMRAPFVVPVGMWVAAVIAMLLLTPTVEAATHLTISIETRNSARQKNAKIPADSQQNLDVVLGDEYLSVDTGKETSILDFKTRRRIAIDDDAKTYVDYSLYDIVGFRELEFRNRQMLRKSLAAARVPGVLNTSTDDEHLLSVLSGVPAKLTEADTADDIVFSNGDHEMMRWSKKGSAVNVGAAQQFAMFLRYTEGGHPLILKSLAAGTLIPETLSITLTELWGTSDRKLTVIGVHQVESVPYSLSAYTPRTASADSNPVDVALDRATTLTPDALGAFSSSVQHGVTQAFRDGHALDAMLGWTELTLMTGRPGDAFTPEQLSLLQGDPSVQLVTMSLRANTRDDLREAADTLLQLRSKTSNKAYVLMLFEANDRARIGDTKSARQLFLDALQENPFLAGAYKDLGDLLLMGYDMPRAWRCWDAGRRIAPQFSNFAAVNRFEKTLVAEQPQYFQ